MPKHYKSIEGWSDFLPIYERAINSLKDGAIFVELGVWYGRSAVYAAELISEKRKNIKFYAVDNFIGGVEHKERVKQLQTPLVEIFTNNLRTAGLSDKVTIICEDSAESAKHFDNGSVDFVYVDAGHSYACVSADIAAWWPKVKLGGTLAGHDYSTSWPDVKQAVNDFVSKFKYNLRIEGASWLVTKATV